MKPQDIEDLLNKSTLPWWEWNTKENKVKFNALKIKMLGYDEKDYMNCGYEKFTSLLHMDDYDKTMNAMKKVLNNETDLYQIDYRIRDINSLYHWYIDRGYVIKRDQTGFPLIIKGIVLNAGLEHDKETVEHIFDLMIHEESNKYLVLCANCKKIKIKHLRWEKINLDSINLITDKVSHSICPDCIKKLYPEFADKLITNMEKHGCSQE